MIIASLIDQLYKLSYHCDLSALSYLTVDEDKANSKGIVVPMCMELDDEILLAVYQLNSTLSFRSSIKL